MSAGVAGPTPQNRGTVNRNTASHNAVQIDGSKAIWIQLVDEFTRRIVTGEWQSGEKVPSVRELALDLGVNPNTVQKALGEVDRTGLTSTERTAGRFVTTDEEAISAARSALAAATADTFVADALGLGMQLSDATTLLAERWAVSDPHPERKDQR